eukprot:UC1_evm1s1913
MVNGLIKSERVQPSHITMTDVKTDRLEQLSTRYGVNTTRDNRAAVAAADVAVFAVKPQTMPTVMADVHGALPDNAVAISIVAGFSLDRVRQGTNARHVARAMPNTPASVGEAMTVWHMSKTNAPDSQQSPSNTASHVSSSSNSNSNSNSGGGGSSDTCADARVRDLLSSFGHEIFVAEEEYIDMATALSGTGPAYAYMIMESMVDAGVHLGLPRGMAKTLVLQTMRGASGLALESGQHLAELRNDITSPGGTSAAALYESERGGLRSVIGDSIWAAYRRSLEIGGSSSNVGPGRSNDQVAHDTLALLQQLSSSSSSHDKGRI